MSCGHVSERTGMVCITQNPYHVSKHRYTNWNRPSRSQEVFGSIRQPLPPEQVKPAGRAAMARYAKSGLVHPGDELYGRIMARLVR